MSGLVRLGPNQASLPHLSAGRGRALGDHGGAGGRVHGGALGGRGGEHGGELGRPGHHGLTGCVTLQRRTSPPQLGARRASRTALRAAAAAHTGRRQARGSGF